MAEKRGPDRVQDSKDSGKRLKVFDLRSRGQQARGRCGKCKQMHDGAYRGGGPVCYKCGKTGHFSRYCITTT